MLYRQGELELVTYKSLV